MDRKINKYQQSLINWLEIYVKENTSSNIEYQLITDTVHYHYQIVRTGWDGNKFLYLIVFHFQIKEDGKIWVWANNTDLDLGQVLSELGIPNNQIVPALQPPFVRQHTGYAVA
jgi:XisI protein